MNPRHFTLYLFLSCVFLSSCDQQKVIDLSEFVLRDTLLQIEVVAAEPEVILPVAMAEDDRGRLWVAELTGYMRDIDGNDEELADGRIVILEDTDQDGRMDQRTVFRDALRNPRAVALAYGGVLYTDGPALMWSGITDDQPDRTEVVDSLYVVGGNIEHQPNGLLYHLDNWIYSARSNSRYRKRNGIWHKEATHSRGQWGLSMDQDGRLVYNNNSTPLIGDYSPPHTLTDHPYLAVEQGIGVLYTDNMRIYPIQATAVNRGYQDGVLDTAGRVKHYTSACGPLLYYGQALPEAYYGDAFVCAPEANLIVQFELEEDTFQPRAERVGADTEFLVSTDETFRPVNLYTGLDGALYIVDLRKGIIQHRAYMSNYLREKILDKGLDEVTGLGRIYRIRARSGQQQVPTPALAELAESEIVDLLNHPNLALRMWAQQRLVEQASASVRPSLLKLVGNYRQVDGQIHALWTLEGLGLLQQADLLAVANVGANERLLQQLIILSEQVADSSQAFVPFYQKVLGLAQPRLDYLLAQLSGRNAELQSIWTTLARRYPKDAVMAEALVNGSAGRETILLSTQKDSVLSHLLRQTIQHREQDQLKAPQMLSALFVDDRTNGLTIFKDYCAACHGMDGQGIKQLAPSLADSDILETSDLRVADIILHGYSSETVPYRLQMPAYGLDQNLSDQDIWDIISYLKSTYTSSWNGLRVEQIDSLRRVGVAF